MTYAEYLKKTAKIIKFYRERKGISRNKLGEEIGVSGDHIANYEYGRNFPRFYTMAKIVKVLEIPPDEVFYDVKSKKK